MNKLTVDWIIFIVSAVAYLAAMPVCKWWFDWGISWWGMIPISIIFAIVALWISFMTYMRYTSIF